MQKIELGNGLVLICGASATGKSTAADEIYRLAPYRNKTKISTDERLPSVMEENGIVTVDDQLQRFKSGVLREDFLILDVVFNEEPQLYTALMLLDKLGISKRPVAVLIFNPSEKLHREFYESRERKTDPYEVCIEREVIRSIVRNRYYRLFKYAKTYIITDPRDVKFCFV